MRAKMHTALALTSLLALGLATSVSAAKAPIDARIGARAALGANLSPAAGGAAGPVHRSAVRVPLVVELDKAPGVAELEALRGAGGEVSRRADGTARGRGRLVSVEAAAGAVDAIAALSFVRHVKLDGSALPHPRPLDVTLPLLNAPDAHRLRDAAGLDLTGEGMTICDVDSGIDVFHPFFFRADGGVFPWIDANGDGAFTPGVDQVDVGDGPVIVGLLDAVKASYAGAPEEGDDGIYQLGEDFLYADADGSGEREFGADAGFDDATPSLGEMFLLADDVDGDGTLDPEERLVGLGTSKIAAFKYGALSYKRGVSLSKAPWNVAMQHGTGASGVLAGGVPGLTKLTGVAPDADLLMATDVEGGREFQLTDWCIEQGARVVLHEYAPWVGYHLDGSSPMEELIDDTTADGVSHINPAGNLSGAQKLAKLDLPPGEETVLPLRIPAGLGMQVLGFTFLWRTPARDLTFRFQSPSGETVAELATTQDPRYEEWPGGYELVSQRWDSDRGTAMTIGYLYPLEAGAGALEAGDYEVHIIDPAGPAAAEVELIAYVLDEVSGWGLGAHFPEHVSEDHLVGYPATADHGMGIAAYVARGAVEAWGAPGERAGYSGRGYRIDGERNLWISGPADPFTSGKVDGVPLSLIQYGGTSGASPHVAGAAALLLQNEPSLTGDDVRQRLADTAIVDEFTGNVPNDDFGFGKVDAFRAITGEAPPSGTAPTVAAGTFEVTVGQDSEIELVLADAEQETATLEVEIDVAYDGSVDVDAVGPRVSVRVDTEGEHLGRVRVRDATGRTGSAVVRFVASVGEGTGGAPGTTTVGAGGLGGADPSSGSGDAADDEEDDGCGCRLPGGAPSGGGAAALFAAALGVAARRRRRQG